MSPLSSFLLGLFHPGQAGGFIWAPFYTRGKDELIEQNLAAWTCSGQRASLLTPPPSILTQDMVSLSLVLHGPVSGSLLQNSQESQHRKQDHTSSHHWEKSHSGEHLNLTQYQATELIIKASQWILVCLLPPKRPSWVNFSPETAAYHLYFPHVSLTIPIMSVRLYGIRAVKATSPIGPRWSPGTTCPVCFLIWKYSQNSEPQISPFLSIKGHTWLSPLASSLLLSLEIMFVFFFKKLP